MYSCLYAPCSHPRKLSEMRAAKGNGRGAEFQLANFFGTRAHVKANDNNSYRLMEKKQKKEKEKEMKKKCCHC